LEHSRDYIGDENSTPMKKVKIDAINTRHVRKGIDKLRENNIRTNGSNAKSTNPMASMMKFIQTMNETISSAESIKPVQKKEDKPVHPKQNLKELEKNKIGMKQEEFFNKVPTSIDDDLMIDMVRNGLMTNLAGRMY